MLAVVVAAFAVIPTAISAGQAVYDSGVRTAREQQQTRHSVEALVTGQSALSTELETPAKVIAQWQEGARVRTESIVAPATIRPGDRMTVWLDDGGKVVAAPWKIADAKVYEVVAATSVWLISVMVGALAASLFRRILDRMRARAWTRELHLLAYNDDGWANRHT